MMLLTLAIAATAVAAEPNLMALPQFRRDVLEPRQTVDIPGFSGECQSALSGIVGAVPTPPPRLASELLGGSNTDPCSVSVPSALSSEYSSYSGELSSWYSASSSELNSALSQCPDLASLSSLLPVCTSDIIGGGGAGGGSSTGSGTDSAGSMTGTMTDSSMSGSMDMSSGSMDMTSGSMDMTSGASESTGTPTDDNGSATDTASESASSPSESNPDSAAPRENGRAGAIAALVAIGFAAAVM